MGFIPLLIMLAIFVLILLSTILYSVVRTVFSMLGYLIGGRRRGRASSHRADSGGAGTSSYSRTRSGNTSSQHKKVFDADEGEYVDFEEIKDER